MTVAQTILEQLGGNKFIAMTGSKNFVDGENSLSMHLARNRSKAMFLKITLDGEDLYKMEFTKIKKTYTKVEGYPRIVKETLATVKTVNGVYCDQLKEFFTDVTGMDTRL
jgi:hypothetical protein